MHLHLQTTNLRQCTTCIVCAMLCSYISLFIPHDSSSFHHHALFFSASVRWWFLLSPLHNLLVVVPKAFLAPAEICGTPDGGQWSDTDIHLSFMVRFHDRSEENRSQPYRNHDQSERWMGPRKIRRKCWGTWTGQYTIKFSVLISVEWFVWKEQHLTHICNYYTWQAWLPTFNCSNSWDNDIILRISHSVITSSMWSLKTSTVAYLM